MINFIRKLTGMRQRPKQAMLFLLLMSAGQMAYAQCPVTNNPQDIIMNVDRVLITPPSKVGNILATGKFDIPRNNSISCSGNSTLFVQILQGAQAPSVTRSGRPTYRAS